MSAQKGFDGVSHWQAAISLTLNAAKTKYIPFCIRNTISSTCIDLDVHAYVHMHDVAVKILAEYKAFDIWELPTNCKIKKKTFIFKQLKQIADCKTLRKVYLALVQSLLVLRYGVKLLKIT